jgi:hypothetical protein
MYAREKTERPHTCPWMNLVFSVIYLCDNMSCLRRKKKIVCVLEALGMLDPPVQRKLHLSFKFLSENDFNPLSQREGNPSTCRIKLSVFSISILKTNTLLSISTRTSFTRSGPRQNDHAYFFTSVKIASWRRTTFWRPYPSVSVICNGMCRPTPLKPML